MPKVAAPPEHVYSGRSVMSFEPSEKRRQRTALPEHPKPFLKWAGGKWALIDSLTPLLPSDLDRRVYREPFVGGGALFFYLQGQRPPREVYLSDALGDLVKAYKSVRDKPAALLSALQELEGVHSPEQYYRVREAFNSKAGTQVERAAWLIYLNKTCYNGLFRTNRSGLFNVPIGRFERPRIADEPRITAASKALRGVEIQKQSFEAMLEVARKGDVIYFDPPYVPVSRTSNFASYSLGAFTHADQAKLADVFRKLDTRGCLLLLSNSDSPAVHELYQGFEITTILAPRSISARGSARKPIAELVIRNSKRFPR